MHSVACCFRIFCGKAAARPRTSQCGCVSKRFRNRFRDAVSSGANHRRSGHGAPMVAGPAIRSSRSSGVATADARQSFVLQVSLEDFEWRSPTANQKLSLPVIRPGDSVILSEDSPVSHALLEAIALQSAATGQVLTVRLKLGGHLLRAIATAPGCALLAEGDEVQR